MQKLIHKHHITMAFVAICLTIQLRSQGFTGPYSPPNWTATGSGWYSVDWNISGDPFPIFVAEQNVEISVVFPLNCYPNTLEFIGSFYSPTNNAADYEVYYAINGVETLINTDYFISGFIPINPLDTFSIGFRLNAPFAGQLFGGNIESFMVLNNDPTPPVSQLPADMIIPANASCVGEVNYLPDSNSYASLFSDPDCGTYMVFQIEGIPPTGQFPMGTTLNVFQAWDGTLNVVTDSFTVTVIDTSGLMTPSVENLPIVYGMCNATVTDIPTAIENCTGFLVNGTTNDPLVYTQPGIYEIIWSYQNQSNIITQTQTVAVIEGCVGIEEANINTPIIYPNPSDGNVLLNFPQVFPNHAYVRLFNLYGQMIYEGKLQHQTENFDFSYLTSATYYLQVSTAEVLYTLPLIIQK